MNYEIAPDFSYRFSVMDIKRWYGSLEKALDAGDYNLVATYAAAGSELKGCALILSGLFVSGLKILEDRDNLSAFAKVCLGFGLWTADRPVEAIRVLRSLAPLDSPWYGVAEKLMQRIEAPDITVFTISVALPFLTKETANARNPSCRYGQFFVKHVASQLTRNSYAFEYFLTDPFDEFINYLPQSERPDFIFSMSPQSILPLNYEKVAIPKLMWCHDTDLFLYRGYENFQLNDINIVSTSQEHFELSRALGTPCISNIMSDTLCMPSKPARLITDKSIDVLFTGSSVTSFHSEKSRFMYYMAKLSDEFNIRIVDGHMPEEDYLKLVEDARFVAIVNRYAGVTSPRWREGLSLSAQLLYPDGTPYDCITPGTFPYRADAIEEDFRRHLRACRDTGNQAGSPYNVAENFRAIDDGLAFLREPRDKQVERQLRFCTFALLLNELKGKAVFVPEPRRRLAWYVPPVDGMLWGGGTVKSRMTTIANNFGLPDTAEDKDINNAALVYTQIIHGLGTDPSEKDHCLQRRKEILTLGLQLYPDSLLLRFNQAHWEFILDVLEGRKPQVETLDLFRKIVADFDRLDFDPVGSDVGVAYTLVHTDLVFPYYDYGQLMVRWLVRKNTPDYQPKEDLPDPRQVILAAVYGYIGWGTVLLASNGDSAAGVALFHRSLALFGDNLPLKRLLFRTLQNLYVPGSNREVARQLVDAYFLYINKFPAALLTDIEKVLLAVDELGDTRTLRYLLSEWYTFARTVTFLASDDVAVRLRRSMTLMRFREHFPDVLKERIGLWRERGTDMESLSSLERELFVALTYGDWCRLMGLPEAQAFSMPILPHADGEATSLYIADMKRQLEELRGHYKALVNSRSWKLTKPLRLMMRYVKGTSEDIDY